MYQVDGRGKLFCVKCGDYQDKGGMDFSGVQEWYAKKINKGVDEFDDYDKHICNVVKEYAKEIKCPCGMDLYSGD